MSQDTLNEREFELINIIGANLAASQRDLSRHSDLSLGMTNMIIRRLISKGYIRIRQLNKRKVEYLLTPKGFAEKTRKSVKYTLKTIQSIGLIRKRLKEVIQNLYQTGERRFFVFGASDLVDIVEMTFKEILPADYQLSMIAEIPKEKLDGTILFCREDGKEKDLYINKFIDLIEEISRSNDIVEHSNRLSNRIPIIEHKI